MPRYDALYSTLGGFYRKSEEQLYLTPSDLRVMSDADLVDVVAEGLTISDKIRAQLEAEDKARLDRMVGLAVVLSVGAFAWAASGTATAAAPANSAASGGGAAAISPGSAATAASSGSGWFPAMQDVAKAVQVADKIRVKVTGDEPSKIAQAAELMNSENWTEAIQKGVKYQLGREGVEIAEDDAAANAALRELVQREQAAYAANLRALAAQQAQDMGLPPPPETEPEKKSFLEVAAVATPILLALWG